MQYTYTEEECAETDNETLLELQDGHTCFISVKVQLVFIKYVNKEASLIRRN